MKYDKIVRISKENSKYKANIAKNAIYEMLNRKERITVTALVKYTGLSKAIFYENLEVRKVLDDAFRQQGACYNPRQIIIDKVMEENNQLLKTKVEQLKKSMQKLQDENEQLKETNKKLLHELNIFKKI